MKRWLAKVPLALYEQALTRFDAWIFHPQHLERRNTIMRRLMKAGMLTLGVLTAALYLLILDLGLGESAVPIVGLMIVGYLVVADMFYLGVMKLLHTDYDKRFYLQAYAVLQGSGERLNDALFVQRCKQLEAVDELHSLARVEGWLAMGLWNDTRRQGLRHAFLHHGLPPARQKRTASGKPRL